MRFRTLFIVNRIVAPVAFAVFAICFLIPTGPIISALRVLALVPFVAACAWGAWLGLRFQREVFLPMRCPLCGRTGLVGRGATREVGWWLRCDECGIVRPRRLLGLSFTKQSIVDEDEVESNENTA